MSPAETLDATTIQEKAETRRRLVTAARARVRLVERWPRLHEDAATAATEARDALAPSDIAALGDRSNGMATRAMGEAEWRAVGEAATSAVVRAVTEFGLPIAQIVEIEERVTASERKGFFNLTPTEVFDIGTMMKQMGQLVTVVRGNCKAIHERITVCLEETQIFVQSALKTVERWAQPSAMQLIDGERADARRRPLQLEEEDAIAKQIHPDDAQRVEREFVTAQKTRDTLELERQYCGDPDEEETAG